MNDRGGGEADGCPPPKAPKTQPKKLLLRMLKSHKIK